MVLLDEKCSMIPPPPYTPAGSVPPPPFNSADRPHENPSTLPPHLLLHVVYMTFPCTHAVDHGSRPERQRKTLRWLVHQLRLVNRSFYIACMHVLRSTYLPSYSSLIRVPYTSDPFPLSSLASSLAGPVEALQRETKVLDLFIALKVHEDVMMDESELHLEREESFKDLFDLMQPRSRLEDLVRHYGLREGVVYTAPSNASSSSLASNGSQLRNQGRSANSRTSTTTSAPIPFSKLSASFSPKKLGLVLTSSSGKRTIVEVVRTRDEKLEVSAKKLVRQLKVWLNDA